MSLLVRSIHVALVAICLFAGMQAVELKAKSKLDLRKFSHGLRGGAGAGGGFPGMPQNDLDDDDDFEDDDDDDDDDKMVTQVTTDPLAWHKAEADLSSPAAVALYKQDLQKKQNAPAAPGGITAMDAKKPDAATKVKEDIKIPDAAAAKATENEIEEKQGALEAAQERVQAAASKTKAFKDEKAFDETIALEVKQIANETQSPALSTFLGAMRHEMRSYATPEYTQYLEGKVDAADKRVKDLEEELGKPHAPAEAKKVVAPMKEQSKDKPEKAAEKKGAGAEAEKSEKKDGGEEEAVSSGAEEEAKKAGETFAISFFANIALLAGVFAMAQAKNTVVKNYTWFIIDQVILIFLAVMYFQTFDSLLDFGGMGVHNSVLASVLHSLVLLAMILTAAYVLRRNDVGLAILCGAGAHVVSFSSIHAAASVQNYWVGLSYTWLSCIFGFLVLGSGLAIIGYLVYTAKGKAQLLSNGAFMDKTDDLENDFGAMAFSVVFTMFVRFLLTGHHPVDDEAEFDHTQAQRTYMFIYACACLIVAALAVTFCSKKAAETDSYAVKRIVTFFNTVAAMNVAWAFLYWGEWEFFGALYSGEAIKGRVMFAIVATVFCGLALIGLANIVSPSAKVDQRSKMVALTALGLVIAWSWELCFDAAVEEMTVGVAHPAGWKVATTLALFAIIVPVYAYYVKPITGPAAEAIGA